MADVATAPPRSVSPAPGPRSRGRRIAAWFGKYRVQAIGLAAGAVVWELVGRAGISPAVPAFSEVVTAGTEIWTSERFAEAVRTTATALLIAFPPSLIIGVVLGMAMGLVRPVEWALRPYINLALSLPLVAVIPIVLLMFGLSMTTIVVVIVLYVLPVVMANTFAGVRSTDPDLLEMAESFEAGRWLTIRRVVIPASRALTLAGLRIGLGRAISGAIVAEQIVGVFGVGGLVQRLGGAFAVEPLYAVILFIGGIGVASLAMVNRIEKRYEIKGA